MVEVNNQWTALEMDAIQRSNYGVHKENELEKDKFGESRHLKQKEALDKRELELKNGWTFLPCRKKKKFNWSSLM